MTVLNRVRVEMNAFQGSPGVATFYTLDTATIVESLHTLYTNLANQFPQTMSILVESTGDQIEDTTGAITGSWGASPSSSSIGNGTGPYSAPSGACVTWHTNTLVHNHRLRGRTFMVPLNGTAYASNGSLSAATKTAIEGECLAFLISQSASLVIWSRPFAGTPAAPGRAANPARLGSHGLVTAVTVSTTAAILRSRRD